MPDEITQGNGSGTPQNRTEMAPPRTRKQKLIRLSIGVFAGGLLGFAYYAFIGCSSGGCPITSSPYISTLYGSLFGAVIAYG